MPLVADLAKKICKKNWKMTETPAHGYSYESSHWELSNEYQYDGLDGFQKSLRPCPLEKK